MASVLDRADPLITYTHTHTHWEVDKKLCIPVFKHFSKLLQRAPSLSHYTHRFTHT